MTTKPHGTTQRYRSGCHCAECRTAAAAYEYARVRRPGGSTVPSGPTLQHLRALRAAGLTNVEVGRRAGVTEHAVRRIYRAGPEGTLRRDTERALLGVRVPALPFSVPEPPYVLPDDRLVLHLAEVLEARRAARTWSGRAACRGLPNAWFFPNGQPGNPSQRHRPRFSEGELRAKAVCAGCPVRVECGAANREVRHGVFGGLTEQERRRAA